MSNMDLLVAIAITAIIVLCVFLYFAPVGMWFSARVSGVYIPLRQLILMRWRKVPPSVIVSAMIGGTKAGLRLDIGELEAHYLARGNVANVVHALILAKRTGIVLNFKMASAIDLAGHDVLEAVQTSVNRKEIDTSDT